MKTSNEFDNDYFVNNRGRGIDLTKEWMENHNFKFLGWIRDRKGYRFATVSTYDDGKTYITCSWRGFGSGVVGLDYEIVNREPYILDKLREFLKHGKIKTLDYVYLIFDLKGKHLYIADVIYDLKSRNYPIQEGNELSKKSPYMEQRKLYEIPIREAELLNFFNNKSMNEGEKYWKEMFTRYIRNAIKWVGSEFTGRYLKDAYGWGVDFIVLAQTNKCIEVGYHNPNEKNKRIEEAKKHNVNAYFINHSLEYYQKDVTGKRLALEIASLAEALDLELTDRYYIDFSHLLATSLRLEVKLRSMNIKPMVNMNMYEEDE